MKRILGVLFTIAAIRAVNSADPALTFYNQDFAVVRDTVPLDLKPGTNRVRFVGTTANLEPSSVVLRDPAGKQRLAILEQNYRADPVTQEMLLTLNEGKTIQFEVVNQEGSRTRRELISGKVIRSGYGLQQANASPYGFGGFGVNPSQPIIEVDGKLRFSLPGQPIFPTLADDTILKPTLHWVIATDQAARLAAEISYVSGGMRWESDYNLVMPEKGNMLDLVGWVTMDNQSGKTFDHARIKLMAGDVNKIQRFGGYQKLVGSGGQQGGGFGGGMSPPVTEKSFDEYHLYTLENSTTLHDRETKQVEFVRAENVQSAAIYVYDGAKFDPYLRSGGGAFPGFAPSGVNTEAEYGIQCNKKVWVMREFTNSAANHLGLPLPKGTVRFYRRNSDGQLEFTGENVIEHTPRDEVIRLSTGNAFDIIGERKRTEFNVNFANASGFPAPALGPDGLPLPASGSSTNAAAGPWIDESFEIMLRNHKREPVEIRVVEHLYRWSNWVITKQSDPCRKTESQTVEFPIQLKPDEERVVTYTVHYSW